MGEGHLLALGLALLRLEPRVLRGGELELHLGLEALQRGQEHGARLD